jgi:thiamine monophosphate synthase
MHILAITPGLGLDPALWERVLRSGVDAVMVREPQLDARELLVAVRWVRDLAPNLGLWVNGRLDVALAARCGLHAPEAYPQVPQGLLATSNPIHDPAQIPGRSAADQLILSPIFPVPGKGPAWGTEKLHAVLDAMPRTDSRILALGGISPENAPSLKHRRLDGVALIRGLWSAPDPGLVVSRLRAAWGTEGFRSG